MTFELKPNHIDIDNNINNKFIAISNRQASFNNMSTDEKLSEIANLIEYLLKKDGKFITLDYSVICFEYISSEIVTSFRKKCNALGMLQMKQYQKENLTQRNKKISLLIMA